MKGKLETSKSHILNDLQSHMMYLDHLETKINNFKKA